jgi:hypothetical protein
MSRLRDDFELAALAELPSPYDEASVKREREWLAKLRDSQRAKSLFGLPTPPCPAGAGPWIILATAVGRSGQPPALQSLWRRLVPRSQDLLGLK